MAWPPRIGDQLHRAGEAAGVRRKLVDYSLDLTNEVGGPKAKGFERLLGIAAEDADYLEGAIQTGIFTAPIVAVRDNSPYGINCVVAVPRAGTPRAKHASSQRADDLGGRRKGHPAAPCQRISATLD
jgi:hypothetical protein